MAPLCCLNESPAMEPLANSCLATQSQVCF
jgi:hypothetical protein